MLSKKITMEPSANQKAKIADRAKTIERATKKRALTRQNTELDLESVLEALHAVAEPICNIIKQIMIELLRSTKT